MSSTPNQASSGPQAGAAKPTGELAVLANVQHALRQIPGAVPVATGLSHLGEHAMGWFAFSALGMVAQPQKRNQWAMVGVGTFTAHAASVLLKRVVRRRRPQHLAVEVGVKTPSTLSFPSSHATSTTAFAVLASSVNATPITPVLVPAMLSSRLVLGVHYPSDVAAGAVLGAGCAAATRRLWPHPVVQQLLPLIVRGSGVRPTDPSKEKR